MSGLEGSGTGWAGALASVLVLVLAWTALIAGLGVIVRTKKQAEEEVESDLVRRLAPRSTCHCCYRPMDRQLVYRLSEGQEDGEEPPPAGPEIRQAYTSKDAR
jgi:hypothetical protein